MKFQIEPTLETHKELQKVIIQLMKKSKEFVKFNIN